MRIFIGYDPVESIAYHVLVHSIVTRASTPASVAPVGNTVLPANIWTRKRSKHDSTEFSNARFMVPWLAGYDGWALFMDCDMLCLGDISDLFDLAEEHPDKAVLVRQHNHRPMYGEKFLGSEQTMYPRKNWSSCMLMNCGHPIMRGLTPEFVCTAPGLDLHGFKWCPDAFIGELPAGWNTLIEHGPKVHDDTKVDLKLVHFTQGGPWHGYLAQMYASQWMSELEDLLVGSNPRAGLRAEFSVARGRMRAEIEYAIDTGRPGDRGPDRMGHQPSVA